MPPRFDVIVLGLGGMGSAAAYHLARRGQRVLGLEQFSPAHDRGSSHGKSRIIRQAYFENSAYVPLLLRAYDLWDELQGQAGERLLFETGGLMIGRPDSGVVAGSTRSAQEHDLPHEILTAREIARRFPALSPPADHVALFEKHAGYLLPERCTFAHLDQARRHGAGLHFEEAVISWAPTARGICVKTARATYEADRLVISPGPWAPQVLADAGFPLVVERQVLYWFGSSAGSAPFLPGALPVYIWDKGDGTIPYGFPAIDGPQSGTKVAFHQAPDSTLCTPESVERLVHPEEIATMQAAIRPLLSQLDGPCIQAITCLYTNTPDGDFILSRHPASDRVFLACGFSGHGFKFASVIGEVLADLVIQGSTAFDIDFLQPRRFATR